MDGELPGILSVFIKPFLCSLASVGTAAVLYLFLVGRVAEPIVTILSIISAALIYGLLIVKSRTVLEEEINLLPMGNKIAGVLKKAKIL